MKRLLFSLILISASLFPLNCFAWKHDMPSMCMLQEGIYADAAVIAGYRGGDSAFAVMCMYSKEYACDTVFFQDINMRNKTYAVLGYNIYDAKDNLVSENKIDKREYKSIPKGSSMEMLYRLYKERQQAIRGYK